MRGLYPIVDLETAMARGWDPLEQACELLAEAPPLLQLRAKTATPRQVLPLLRALVTEGRARRVPIVVNDRPDLALLAGASWVHVGQDDLPVAEVRRLDAALRVGVSTHDLAQLDAALAERPDYVAYGPVFRTTSKQNPDPVVGLDRLAMAAARSRAAGVPLVAIGGIGADVVGAVAAHADLVATITAVAPAGRVSRVRAVARELAGAIAREQASWASS